MEIKRTLEGNKLTLELIGRLDTTTVGVFEEELKTLTDNINELVLDFKALEYISSAGLRVLLVTQKRMNLQGKMVIKNVCEDINDVFEITGFKDILTIE